MVRMYTHGRVSDSFTEEKMGRFSGVSRNGCRIARDRAMERIGPPPDGVFQAGSIFGASEKSNRASHDFLRRRLPNSRFVQRS